MYLRKARTSVARMPVLAMTKSETYAISSGSCLIEPSSSSVRLSSRAPRTTLRKATVTNAPTPAWIHVSFIRGASRPPTRSPTAHVRTTNGSTSRSNLRSIGSWKVSSMSLNGTIQSTARKPANVHGSSRVVCGQSSPTRPGVRGSRISGCPSRRRVSSVRPNHVEPRRHEEGHERDRAGHAPVDDGALGRPERPQPHAVRGGERLRVGDVGEVALEARDRRAAERLRRGDRRRLGVHLEHRGVRPRLDLDAVRAALAGDVAGALLAARLRQRQRHVRARAGADPDLPRGHRVRGARSGRRRSG